MLQSTWSLPPQPLLEVSQAPLDYPVAALGDLLGPAVVRMAEVMGVPQAMAAQSVLATSALATQGHANVQLDGRVYATGAPRRKALIIYNLSPPLSPLCRNAPRQVPRGLSPLSPRSPKTKGIAHTSTI